MSSVRELPRALTSALEAHEAALLAFARDLVTIPSENPPGRYYRACVDRIRDELRRLGHDCEVIDGPGEGEHQRFALLAGIGSGPTVYFHGHYDVVPADRPDQFAPRVEGGRLYGRGSSDMKSGLAGMVYAMHLLYELAVPLRGRVALCVVPDEETGGQGGSRVLNERGLLGRDGLAMFTPEPTSGVIWNANRGAVTLRVTVQGRAAHVGLQHQGVNAFEQMLTVASALQALKAEVETRRTAYRVTPDAAARSILMLGGRVEGGTNFNVVPETCTFTVDRRFNPEEDLETEKAQLLTVFERLRSQGIALDVEVLQEGHSCGVSDDHPAARALADAGEAVTGERPVFEMCPGLLEIRWYARKGIPAFAYGPGWLEVSHGPREVVDIGRMYQHAVIYAMAAARLLS